MVYAENYEIMLRWGMSPPQAITVYYNFSHKGAFSVLVNLDYLAHKLLVDRVAAVCGFNV